MVAVPRSQRVPASPEGPAATNWQEAVSRGVRAVAGLASILAIATSISPLLRLGGNGPDHALGTLLVLSSQIIALLGIWIRAQRAVLVTALSLSFLSGALLVTRSFVQHDALTVWSPVWWATPVLMLALGRTTRRRGWAPLIGLLTGLSAVEAWGGLALHRPASMVLLGTLSMFCAVLTVALFIDALSRLARGQQEAWHQAAVADGRARRERLQAEQEQNAARILHDHLLHSLIAVATPIGQLPTETVRETCRQALQTLNDPQPAPATSLRGLVRDNVASTPTRWIGDVLNLPDPVLQTLAQAIKETLNNVDRHARASQCTITCDVDRHGATVTVADDGVGFDPHRVPAQRLGIRRSVEGRLEEIGGLARIRSRPRHGTVVTLRWPAPDSPLDTPPFGSGRREANTLFARTALPGLFQAAVVCLTMTAALPDPVLAAATTLLALAVGTGLTLHAMNDELCRTTSALLALVSLLGWLANLLLVPRDATNGYLLWMAGGSTAMVQVVLLARPLREALLVAVGLVGTITASLVWRFGQDAAFGPLYGAITAAANVAVCGLAGVAVAGRILHQTALAEQLAGQLAAAARRQRGIGLADAWWSQRVLRPAGDLLGAVADGSADPVDPAVQATARRLAADLRDELRLGPAASSLCEVVSERRREGWQVTTSLSEQVSPESLRDGERLLHLLGPADAAGQSATLSSSLPGSTAAASLIVLGSSPDQRARWSACDGLRLVLDPDFVALHPAQPSLGDPDD